MFCDRLWIMLLGLFVWLFRSSGSTPKVGTSALCGQAGRGPQSLPDRADELESSAFPTPCWSACFVDKPAFPSLESLLDNWVWRKFCHASFHACPLLPGVSVICRLRRARAALEATTHLGSRRARTPWVSIRTSSQYSRFGRLCCQAGPPRWRRRTPARCRKPPSRGVYEKPLA